MAALSQTTHTMIGKVTELPCICFIFQNDSFKQTYTVSGKELESKSSKWDL
jgi:hypothetical protein